MFSELSRPPPRGDLARAEAAGGAPMPEPAGADGAALDGAALDGSADRDGPEGADPRGGTD